MNGRPWLGSEDDLLMRLYPDYAALQEALPTRTRQSIKSRARALGIQRHMPVWTGAKLERLRGMARAGATVEELLAAFPERSRQIILRLRREAVGRLRTRGAPTGLNLVDDLRERCFRQGIPLARVGRAVGAKSALRVCAYRKTRVFCADWAEEACALLGGELYVEWGE